MKSVQKLWAELSAKEVELSEEKKVELNLVANLKELEKELERGIDELMQYATDARESISKGVREMNRLDAVYKVAQRISQDAESSAKDLGIDIPEIKQVKRMISAYEQQKKSLTKVLN